MSNQLSMSIALNDEQEQFLRELVGPVGKFFEVIWNLLFGAWINLSDLDVPCLVPPSVLPYTAGSERSHQEWCLREGWRSHHGGSQGDGSLWLAGTVWPGRSRPLKHTGGSTDIKLETAAWHGGWMDSNLSSLDLTVRPAGRDRRQSWPGRRHHAWRPPVHRV